MVNGIVSLISLSYFKHCFQIRCGESSYQGQEKLSMGFCWKCEDNLALEIGFWSVGPVLNSFLITYHRAILEAKGHLQPLQLVDIKQVEEMLLNLLWEMATGQQHFFTPHSGHPRTTALEKAVTWGGKLEWIIAWANTQALVSHSIFSLTLHPHPQRLQVLQKCHSKFKMCHHPKSQRPECSRIGIPVFVSFLI